LDGFIYLSFEAKNIMEGSKDFSLRRPICDGKYDVGECSVKVVLQSLLKIGSGAMRIIREGTTTA